MQFSYTLTHTHIWINWRSERLCSFFFFVQLLSLSLTSYTLRRFVCAWAQHVDRPRRWSRSKKGIKALSGHTANDPFDQSVASATITIAISHHHHHRRYEYVKNPISIRFMLQLSLQINTAHVPSGTVERQRWRPAAPNHHHRRRQAILEIIGNFLLESRR